MTITSHLFEAYLKCSTKCFLRSLGETGTGNAYADWAQAQSSSYRSEAITRLKDGVANNECVTGPLDKTDLKSAKWHIAADSKVCGQDIESAIHAVERVSRAMPGKPAQFVPIRFVFRNKVTRDDKLLLAFDAQVLSEAMNRGVGLGKIVYGDDYAALRVKLPAYAPDVRKLTDKIGVLLAGSTVPDLVLNRHCIECEFQSRCRQKAIEKDDLSLLGSMKEKERADLNSKGIFTVTQLSYTFRPRHRPKGLKDKRERYHSSLKALAIREKKTHIVGTPELKIEGTPVYLDVEGLPDRDFYCLIGVRIGAGDSVVQHSFWADNSSDEGRIWEEFLARLMKVENCPAKIGSHTMRRLKSSRMQVCQREGRISGQRSGKALTKTEPQPSSPCSTLVCQMRVGHAAGVDNRRSGSLQFPLGGCFSLAMSIMLMEQLSEFS